ncbi:unnamed protein product [Symbiodinium sp. CCMP2456]|nr:unnamed protein product [Symbiodinium sp. CCMP2456]
MFWFRASSANVLLALLVRGVWCAPPNISDAGIWNVSFLDARGEENTISLRMAGGLEWCSKSGCRRPSSLQFDFNNSMSIKGCEYRLIGRLAANASSTPKPATSPGAYTVPPTLAASLHVPPHPFLRSGFRLPPIQRRLEAAVIGASIGSSSPAEQRAKAREVLTMAQQAKLPVSGSALDELRPLEAKALNESSKDEGRMFPVPLQLVGDVVIVLNWSNASKVPCLTIVEKPQDCSSCAFGPVSCIPVHLQAAEQARPDTRLLSYSLKRPDWLLAKDASDQDLSRQRHSVCIREVGDDEDAVPTLRLLGPLSYYRLPQLTFLKGFLIVGVRTFINPGWSEEINLKCTNCSSVSQVVIRPINFDPMCRSVSQQMAAALTVAVRAGEVGSNIDLSDLRSARMEDVVLHGNVAGINCPLPAASPCGGYAEGAFAVGEVKASSFDDEHVTYVLQSSRRLSGHEKQVFFHHRSAICLYPGGPSSHGFLVGFAVVHMNVLDMQAFIGFVCFFGVALPLICLVTALLHYNKYERCKHHVRHLRLEYQREQLERELATGNEEEADVSTRSQRSGHASSSSRDAHAGAARGALEESSYQPLAGEPAATSSAFLRPS